MLYFICSGNSGWGREIDKDAASRYPTADDFPPTPAFPEWRAVTFRNGALEMAARDGRNLAYRPIYLRRLVPHRFEVDVQLSGGATVKLRARGYDKLDGRAQIVDTSKQSRTLRVEFTPRQHGMGRGLPDPAYVLIALDHDGTGTATWSNPRLTVLAPEKDKGNRPKDRNYAACLLTPGTTQDFGRGGRDPGRLYGSHGRSSRH